MDNSGKKNLRLDWRRNFDTPGDGTSLVPTEKYGAARDPENLLVLGDNLPAMNVLTDKYEGRISLIYIDPPYGTGRKFETESRNGGAGDALAAGGFDDRWDDLSGYLDMMYPRLEMMKRLLSPTGSIYVHVDWRASHYIKVLLDEIFGRKNFQNEIAWCYREAVNSKKRWNRKHDVILFYSRSEKFTFNYREALEPHSEVTLKKHRYRDERGPYRLMGRGLKGSPIRSSRDVSPEWEKNHPELTFRHYITEGRLPVDYWNIDIVNQAAAERTGYPTQKPEALLERIVRVSSNRGDIVADFFCGSGVSAAAAARLGRNWIACDANPAAICTTRNRILMSNAHPDLEILEIESPGIGIKSGLFCKVERTPENKVVVDISGEGTALDFWAVDTSCAGRPFKPVWWSCGGRRRKIETVSPALSIPDKVLHIAVLASEASGQRYFSRIEV